MGWLTESGGARVSRFTTNGPAPLGTPIEQQLDRPAQLDDVMPVRTQGSLAMLGTSLVLLGGCL